jgi:hypothetical protein
MNSILNPFLYQLTAERKYGYFQQDNSMAHTVHDSMDTVCKGLCLLHPQILVIVILSLEDPEGKSV